MRKGRVPAGQRVAYLLRERGMSQAELARATGKTPAAISNIVAGRNDPALSTLQLIIDALGVDDSYFWGVRVPELGDDAA